MAARISRRSFLQRLGLGAGAPLLGSIAGTLLLEARGSAQTGTRKRAVFYIIGDSLHFEAFAPPEHRNTEQVVLPGDARFTMPAAFKSLEPFRKKLLLVDGLALRLRRSQHSGGYGALSGFTAPNDASNEYEGPPGGVTLDQFVAGKLGAATRLRSVLLGQHKYDTRQMTFAAGVNRPEPHHIDPVLMWQRVFEGVEAPAADPAARQAALARTNGRRKLLLDNVRADIARLRGALAGPEREKLDIYLATIEEFDARASLAMPAACKVPPQPAAPGKTDSRVARFDVLFELGSIAMICGLTNVLGVAAGTGMSHKMNIFPGIGHGYPESLPAATQNYDAQAARLGRLMTALQSIREGDRSAFDNGVFVFTSDNGETHHSSKRRWPIAVVGDAGGKLRSDGRFLRFPPTRGTPRALVDLYASIAVALDVPGGERFGVGGVELAQGPLVEVMA